MKTSELELEGLRKIVESSTGGYGIMASDEEDSLRLCEQLGITVDASERE